MTAADLAASSAAELTDSIEQLHGLSCAALRQMLGVVAEYDRRRAWEQDGCGSMVDWIGARLGTTKAHATEMVAVAGALEDLPVLAETFAVGLIGWDKLVLAVELADPDTDAQVAADARAFSVADLRHRVRTRTPISSGDAADQHRRRSFRWWWMGETWLGLGGRLPADQGAVVIKALSRIADHAAPGPHGCYEGL
jgi:hypothetical protein